MATITTAAAYGSTRAKERERKSSTTRALSAGQAKKYLYKYVCVNKEEKKDTARPCEVCKQRLRLKRSRSSCCTRYEHAACHSLKWANLTSPCVASATPKSRTHRSASKNKSVKGFMRVILQMFRFHFQNISRSLLPN